jgi:hypothetical protein
LKNTLRALVINNELRASTLSFRIYLLAMQSTRPTNHIRIVMAGMSGLSMFETEARTSGKGESSFSMSELRSCSILKKDEDWTSGMDVLDDIAVLMK